MPLIIEMNISCLGSLGERFSVVWQLHILIKADGVSMHAVFLAYALGFGTLTLFGIFILADFFKSKKTLSKTVKDEEKI